MKFKTISYSYITHLSIPLKVLYQEEDSVGNSTPFYYCDREELIDFLINNKHDAPFFLDKCLGIVQSIWLEKGDGNIVGLYLDDVETALKKYFKLKRIDILSDIRK
jgi:hypothetical protein